MGKKCQNVGHEKQQQVVLVLPAGDAGMLERIARHARPPIAFAEVHQLRVVDLYLPAIARAWVSTLLESLGVVLSLL